MESKKYDKLVNIANKKQTHRYRKHTSDNQWGDEGEEGQYKGRGEVQTIRYKINTRYMVQHGEYGQYFIFIIFFLKVCYYNGFTVFCQFLLYSKMTHLYIYIYILFLTLSAIMFNHK